MQSYYPFSITVRFSVLGPTHPIAIRVVRHLRRGYYEVAHSAEGGWLSTLGSFPLEEPEALCGTVLCWGDAVNV